MQATMYTTIKLLARSFKLFYNR